jgi:hypothetical protein
MRRRGWWIVGALVLLTNSFVLLGVARNRSGEPEAVITLTERELPIARSQEDDTGMSLRLDHGSVWRLDFLDRSKLEDLGFDCSAAPNAEEAEFFYGKQLPRLGYLVLEYDGDAWQRWLEEQREQVEETVQRVERGEVEQLVLDSHRQSYEKERLIHSRLFPVDAGHDPRELRERYPDRNRVLIFPAVFSIDVDWDWDPGTNRRGPSRLRGYVSQLLVRNIHVSLGHAEMLEHYRYDRAPWTEADPFEEPEKFAPRYTVRLKVGSRYEPWIDQVE